MEAAAAQLSLEHLDYSAQTRVRVDASRQGVGGALFNVRFENGQKSERLVAVCSHAFTETEANWATIEQEAFAMVFACRYWFPLLEGIRFVIDGDHRNLAYVHGGTSPKVIRWGLFMQTLNYMYNHIAGTDNLFPDLLSRQDFSQTGLEAPELDGFPTLEEAASGDGRGAKLAARISRAISRAIHVAEAPHATDEEPLVGPARSQGDLAAEEAPEASVPQAQGNNDDDVPELLDDESTDEEGDAGPARPPAAPAPSILETSTP
jgi:hypothetical protein